jgi:hypothetical protein
MSQTIRLGSAVKASQSTTIPVRYRGRVGTVVRRVKRGKGFSFAVDFPQKAEPLVLPASKLTVVA